MAGKGDPQKSSGYGGSHKAGGGTNKGPNSGLSMSNEQRADVKKAPSSKNPYPKGLA